MRSADALPPGRRARRSPSVDQLAEACARQAAAVRSSRSRAFRRRELAALLLLAGIGLFVAGLVRGGPMALAGYGVALAGAAVAAYQHRARRRAAAGHRTG